MRSRLAVRVSAAPGEYRLHAEASNGATADEPLRIEGFAIREEPIRVELEAPTSED